MYSTTPAEWASDRLKEACSCATCSWKVWLRDFPNAYQEDFDPNRRKNKGFLKIRTSATMRALCCLWLSLTQPSEHFESLKEKKKKADYILIHHRCCLSLRNNTIYLVQDLNLESGFHNSSYVKRTFKTHVKIRKYRFVKSTF